VPWLYLKGISTSDFPEALACLGHDGSGLSPTTVVRLKEVWQGLSKEDADRLSMATDVCHNRIASSLINSAGEQNKSFRFGVGGIPVTLVHLWSSRLSHCLADYGVFFARPPKQVLENLFEIEQRFEGASFNYKVGFWIVAEPE
jgi:hypothetical protein